MRWAVVAGVVLLVALPVAAYLARPGHDAPAAATVAQPQSSQPSGQPPAPPPGAVVLARELGPLAVALEAEPTRLTAIVLSPAGGGLSGLAVRFLPSGARAEPCGSGCYRADAAPARRVTVEIAGRGRAVFALPARAPRADELVRRARAAFRAQAGVSYEERLASDATHAIDASWRLEKPDRFTYTIPGGAAGIVIGTRRWDRAKPGKPWRAGQQFPRLPQPATQWQRATNAHLIARGATSVTVSFADPSVPAFYELTLDPRTLVPRVLHMTAAAHFMTDRYTGFSSRRRILPPR